MIDAAREYGFAPSFPAGAEKITGLRHVWSN